MAKKVVVRRATGDFCEVVAETGQVLYFRWSPELETYEAGRERCPARRKAVLPGERAYGSALHAAHIAMWDVRLDESLAPSSLTRVLVEAKVAYAIAQQLDGPQEFAPFLRSYTKSKFPKQGLEIYLAIMRLQGKLLHQESEAHKQAEVKREEKRQREPQFKFD